MKSYLNWKYKPKLSTNPIHVIGKLEDFLTDFVALLL